ncbi:unnamed protein product [Laminaria digitata]
MQLLQQSVGKKLQAIVKCRLVPTSQHRASSSAAFEHRDIGRYCASLQTLPYRLDASHLSKVSLATRTKLGFKVRLKTTPPKRLHGLQEDPKIVPGTKRARKITHNGHRYHDRTRVRTKKHSKLSGIADLH